MCVWCMKIERCFQVSVRFFLHYNPFNNKVGSKNKNASIWHFFKQSVMNVTVQFGQHMYMYFENFIFDLLYKLEVHFQSDYMSNEANS